MNLSAEDERFLDDIALLMAPWGWARPVGRIYAYLLLRAGPATLDEIAADLGMSKSNASVAARTLEHCGNARRHSEPGSKRIYYAVPDSHGGSFIERAALLGRLETLFERQTERDLPAPVMARFDTLAAFYARMREAMEGVIEGEERARQASERQAG
ncbi:DNA-binding transcriptional regulator GbsR (MarR family) [Novosphingobium chloroacetimidivorans]|uniref:DNA-binding transcriptional regulator GbsR (MarR family) n=1 Tax=Novosphingobium chloroacetimidivorans TaxID=1428314 RepID=A0A7W7K7C2_9SPHN|nr:helix-turn-helix domain-containing protein [Novosphingobium chloroacetimidivorans]MBB4857295.1 DNA-binding transcriptional regulator GbsR (MarR family) [Novosphingobium chloroacetimidivorans]